MKKRKGLKIINLLIAVIFILSACGQGDKNNNTIRLFVSGDASEGNAYAKMAKKYEEETGIKVEVTDIPYADLETKISKAVQSDDAPDVARVAGVSPEWGNALMDLSEASKIGKTLDSMTIKDDEGVVRALPTDVTAVGMFINVDLFEKAGIDYPSSEEEIWTWDEFLSAINQVKNKNNLKYSLVVDPSDHRLRAFTYIFGGKDFYLNNDKSSFETDEETKEALRLFVELNQDGTIPIAVWTSGEDASAMFKSGMVPAYMSGSWKISEFSENIKDFKWKAVYMPYDKVRATNMGGNFMVGFENGKNPEKGKEFIEWLYKPENYKQLAEYAGYLPALQDIELDYGENQEAYNVYLSEIAAADPISGKQTSDQVSMTMQGYKGLTGAYRESMVQLLNDEITFDEMLDLVIKDYNEGYKKE